MTITVDATYENGTLRLERALPLKEHETVRVTVEPGSRRAHQTAGMLGWRGDVETFERIEAEAETSEPVA
jgi:predicted DNA-binding antitoxin AbrB/MazE fold protein